MRSYANCIYSWLHRPKQFVFNHYLLSSRTRDISLEVARIVGRSVTRDMSVVNKVNDVSSLTIVIFRGHIILYNFNNATMLQ